MIKSIVKGIPFIRRYIVPLTRRGIQYIKNAGYMAQYKLISKREYIDDIRNAIENNIGYAAGKIGKTAQYMLQYDILLNRGTDSQAIKQYESGLDFQCLKQQGIFPSDPNFYLQYNKFYMEHIRRLDCLGICFYPGELELIHYYQLKNKLIYYPNQEPDRSIPNRGKECYLPFFNNKKILIICPFAGILKERATKEIFEGVWAKTGKKWFYPKAVDALEFPYGFAKETQEKYATALNLYEYIIIEIEKRDFDIALIGAAGLAIPIASYIKSMGKIGIDLGGALQFFFGVLGKRWRTFKDWDRLYFNEWWIDMPLKYKPKETDVCDHGAYW